MFERHLVKLVILEKFFVLSRAIPVSIISKERRYTILSVSSLGSARGTVALAQQILGPDLHMPFQPESRVKQKDNRIEGERFSELFLLAALLTGCRGPCKDKRYGDTCESTQPSDRHCAA